MRRRTNDDQLPFQFPYNPDQPFQPTYDICRKVRYIMEIGGFKTMDEYSAWLDEPLDDWDTPDWHEMVRCEFGLDDEDGKCDRDYLAYLTSHADAWFQEKEDRLLGVSTEPLPQRVCERAQNLPFSFEE